MLVVMKERHVSKEQRLFYRFRDNVLSLGFFVILFVGIDSCVRYTLDFQIVALLRL